MNILCLPTHRSLLHASTGEVVPDFPQPYRSAGGAHLHPGGRERVRGQRIYAYVLFMCYHPPLSRYLPKPTCTCKSVHVHACTRAHTHKRTHMRTYYTDTHPQKQTLAQTHEHTKMQMQTKKSTNVHRFVCVCIFGSCSY